MAIVEHRVFIVGCPRSGTSLLQSVVGAHPDMVTFPETHFFARVCARSPARAFGLVRPAVMRSTVYTARAGIPFAVPNYYGVPSPMQKPWVNNLIRELDSAAALKGKKGWLEKSPENLHYIDTIQRLVPNARFVHIVREGAPVARSMLKAANADPSTWRGVHKKAYSTLERCAKRWASDVQVTMRLASRPNHAVVRYEDLVADVSCIAESVFTWLDLPADSATLLRTLSRRSEVASEVVMPHEVWKNNLGEEVGASQTEAPNFVGEVSAAWASEIERLEAKIATLDVLGRSSERG